MVSVTNVLIFGFAIFYQVYGSGWGGCPNFPSMPKFNLTRFLGTWYEVERSFYLPEFAMGCTLLTFQEEEKASETDRIEVAVKSINQWTGSASINIGYIHPETKNSSIMDVKQDEEVTTADTSELITEANPTLSQNDFDESEIEDLEEETTDEDESEEENSDDDESTASDNNIIGYTNEAQSRSCYALEDFQLLKTIGTGTFGRVCLCLDQKTNKYCAMKILAKSDVIRLKQVEHVKNEKSILTEIHHPFIVNLIWFTKDDFCLYMLFEYIVGGELFTYLRNAGKFSNSTANFYASEIILALEYLHTLSIVYRDLKPENLLIDREGHLKITDFGFAKKLKDRTWTLCGTPEYLAPEIIQSKGHNKAVDWWGLGVLIYEMLVGYPPFFADNPFGIYEKILTGKYEWPRLVDPVAKDLVKKLLVPDRTKRLGNMKNGPDDIKKHRWFKHLNWDHVYNRQVTPPIIPKIKADGDTSNFDDYPDENPKARPIPKKDMMLFDDF